MINPLWIVLSVFAVLVFGFAIVYYIYKAFSDTEISWPANVYGKSDATSTEVTGPNGEIILTNEMSHLIPLAKDVLVREDKKHGVTIFKLKKLGKTTGEVKSQYITNWPTGQEIDVLVDGDNATLLSKGYDNTIGKMVFIPMARERMDMLAQQIIVKKEKLLQEKKSLWEALAPYFAIVMAFLIVIATTFIMVQGYQQANQASIDAIKELQASEQQMVKENRQALIEMYTALGYDIQKMQDEKEKDKSNLGPQPPSVE